MDSDVVIESSKGDTDREVAKSNIYYQRKSAFSNLCFVKEMMYQVLVCMLGVEFLFQNYYKWCRYPDVRCAC